MSDGLVSDPASRSVILAILVSTGIRAEADLDDAIGDVVVAWAACRLDRPEDRAEGLFAFPSAWGSTAGKKEDGLAIV